MSSFSFVEPSLCFPSNVFMVMVHQNIQVLAKGNGCSETRLWPGSELSHFQCGEYQLVHLLIRYIALLFFVIVTFIFNSYAAEAVQHLPENRVS
jgi:hypothetical protein